MFQSARGTFQSAKFALWRKRQLFPKRKEFKYKEDVVVAKLVIIIKYYGKYVFALRKIGLQYRKNMI